MYIYKITNLINGKVYVGQTIRNIEERWEKHIHSSLNPKYYFHFAIQKYGKENFKIEQIDQAESLEELNQKEIYWIEFYNSYNNKHGYNSTIGGDGCKQNESTKKKNREKKLKNNINKTSKYICVTYCKCTKNYKSEIKIDGIRYGICLSSDEKFCAEMYDSVAKHYLKENAVLNFNNSNIIPMDISEARKFVRRNFKKSCMVKFNGIKKQQNRYFVEITFKNKKTNICSFLDDKNAAKVYDYYCYKIYNKKEKLNFSDSIITKKELIVLICRNFNKLNKKQYKGVWSNGGRFVFQVQKGQEKHIKRGFKTELEAAIARDECIIENNFDWRMLNFPENYFENINEMDIVK